MTPPIKAGQAHSAALVAVRYKLDTRRLPTIGLGFAGTPEFDIEVLVRASNGRDVPATFTVGPDNVPESQHALRLWEEISLAWLGNLGRPSS